jgi:hypothetical protein
MTSKMTVKRLAARFVRIFKRLEEPELNGEEIEDQEPAIAEAIEKYGKEFTEAAADIGFRQILAETIKGSKEPFFKASRIGSESHIREMEQRLNEPMKYIVSDDGTSVSLNPARSGG